MDRDLLVNHRLNRRLGAAKFNFDKKVRGIIQPSPFLFRSKRFQRLLAR